MTLLTKKPAECLLFFIAPLILCAFIRLWNPIGYPPLYFDEGIYIRRAINVLVTHNPQEDPYFYDHPYFGQIFLGSIFWVTGFPKSVHPTINSLQSVESLYLLPRVVMGILAIIDTALIYKISELRYGRGVAFTASTLFAVMPITTLLMRVLLENIQLPFLLASLLIADRVYQPCSHGNRKVFMIVLASGVLLGLAIFTKVPVFTMILPVGYLVLVNTKFNFKLVGVWLIPVILVPLIWPFYAISIGHFSDWLKGEYYQTHRESQTFLVSLSSYSVIDPVLFVLGMAGIVVASVRRDYFLVLWSVPFLIFLYLIGWVLLYHFIPILPAFSVAGARLLVGFANRIRIKRIGAITLVLTVMGILVFGVTTTMLSIIRQVNFSYFEGISYLSNYLKSRTTGYKDNGPTIISDAIYLWIPQQVFQLPGSYKTFYDSTLSRNKPSLLILDPAFKMVLKEGDSQSYLLRSIYLSKNTVKIATIGRPMQNISIYRYLPELHQQTLSGDR